MQFGFSKAINNTDLNFTIGNHKVISTESIKFLGLLMDKKLSWNNQIDAISKRMASGVFLLRKLSSYNCSTDVLKIAYFGLIHPHISYGIIFWGNCGDVKMSRLIILQKSAIRIIARLKQRESCRGAYKSNGILTITVYF